MLVRRFDPSSLYTGTIAAIVAVVFWTYYGSLLFLIGGEVAQAAELRRAELRALTAVGAACTLAHAAGRERLARRAAPVVTAQIFVITR